MELKCPQCGKWMAVSQEELVRHDCQVVCPQCLAVCQYEGGQLVVRDDSDAPYRHTANVDVVTTEKSNYCYHCGKKLPSGISFCPYCGADLRAPFHTQEPTPEVKDPAPVKEKKRPVEQQQPSRQSSPSQQQPVQQSTMVEDKLRTMNRRYKTMHPHIHQNGTMPGKAFKFVAYAIITILILLLIAIIFAGSTLDIPTT